ALAGYLPTLDAIFRPYLARWEQLGRFVWMQEWQSLCYALADSLYTAAEPAIADASAPALLNRFIAGFRALPISLPWTQLGRALQARDEMLAYIEKAARK